MTSHVERIATDCDLERIEAAEIFVRATRLHEGVPAHASVLSLVGVV